MIRSPKSKNKIEYTEQLKTTTEDGTTAYGFIVIDNQKFSYREVEWNEEKHKAAVLLANTHAGHFDFEMLESEFANIDFEGLGMDNLKADLDRFVLGNLQDADIGEGDNMKGTSSQGNEENGAVNRLKLSERFIIPPFSILDNNRFAVFVVGEVRDKKGNNYNFVGDTIKAFTDAGLHFYNEMILVNTAGSLPLRVTKQFNSGRKIGKCHQNVLVFYKGDNKAIKEIYGDVVIDSELAVLVSPV